MRIREEQIQAFVEANQDSICHEDYTPDDLRMMLNAAIQEADAAAWRPMTSAPRDRTDILARTRPDVFPEDHNRSGWNNRNVVIRHEGIVNDDFDMGWSVAAPVGYGGMPDKWFVGWQPLPAPPVGSAELGGVDG